MDKERKEGIFYTASISGGKDSICMGLMLLEKDYPVDDFIFFDLGVDYPETYEALAKFEADTGRKIARITPPEGDFWFYACQREYQGSCRGVSTSKKGYGFPHFKNRWCTRLKRDSVLAYIKQRGYAKKYTVQYIGIAADEPKRIKDDPNKCYPLHEWGITEADALKYCKERGYFQSPHTYDYCNRVSCYCCPCSNQKQIEYLIEHRPELWQIIKDHERPDDSRLLWKLKGTAYFEQQLKLKREAEANQMELGL